MLFGESTTISIAGQIYLHYHHRNESTANISTTRNNEYAFRVLNHNSVNGRVLHQWDSNSSSTSATVADFGGD